MKLSKQLSALHLQALDLVHSDRSLTQDERWFILENFHEGAQHLNGLAGAFFTPIDLALSVHEVYVKNSRSLVDLCSGIGRLSWWAHEEGIPVTCVELNRDYVTAGRRVLPNANWICADVVRDPEVAALRAQMVVSNPPFGKLKRNGLVTPKPAVWSLTSPLQSNELHYAVVEVAQQIAAEGCFILPQISRDADGRWEVPSHLPLLQPTCIDTQCVEDQWRSTSPKVDVAVY